MSFEEAMETAERVFLRQIEDDGVAAIATYVVLLASSGGVWSSRRPNAPFIIHPSLPMHSSFFGSKSGLLGSPQGLVSLSVTKMTDIMTKRAVETDSLFLRFR